MTVINNVDFSNVVDDALAAAKAVVTDNWSEVRDVVKNIADGIVRDVEFIAKKKASGEFNEDDARVFLEDQKMLARIRIRSIAIMTLQLVERVWNAIADVFRTAINNAIGWVLL